MYRIEDLSVKELMEKIGQPVFPGPASGSAVAVGAAMGAALFEMSWRATLKKNPQVAGGAEHLETITEGGKKLLDLSTADMEGYNAYVKAVALKNTDPTAYDEALLKGTQPLVDIAKESVNLLELLDRLQLDCFIKVQGDLAGSASLLHAAVQASILATKINVGLMISDDFSKEVQGKLEEAKEKSFYFHDRIMDRVTRMITRK